jgi:hypothetical protein
MLKDIEVIYLTSGELSAVTAVTNLQNPPADQPAMFPEKFFNVITVNRGATVKAEARTYRRDSGQIPELYRTLFPEKNLQNSGKQLE